MQRDGYSGGVLWLIQRIGDIDAGQFALDQWANILSPWGVRCLLVQDRRQGYV
jgi:hypothetical protein